MAQSKKLLFDVKRTTVCGMSIWVDGYHTAWYFNLAHADVETRIPWGMLHALLSMKSEGAVWIIHNAVYERTMLKAGLNTILNGEGYTIKDYICTLVMAVSAYGPDEYDIDTFAGRGLDDMGNLLPEIISTCKTMQDSDDVTSLMGKIIGKESDATHSYNGYIKQIAYGYGLKKAVKSFFGYDMASFDATLGGHDHMGQLTSLHVANYGCDDAIWCVRLFHRLLQFMMETNPAVVETFFTQELPMVEEYSEAYLQGVVINAQAVSDQQDTVRKSFADATVRLKIAVQRLLPFPAEPHAALYERETAWYTNGYKKYRDKITAWAKSINSSDTFMQCSQLSGAIPNAWATELGNDKLSAKAKAAQLNITHYMPMRVLMYDLFRQDKLIMSKGKVQSDAYARGRLKERLVKQQNEDAAEVMTIIGEMATLEQVAKLYLTPYMKLIDPETGKMHPLMSSILASRRTAMQTPNAQQLSKRNPETTYVRGFYKADHPDHVIVSIDWSQIELVLIGEASGDPYFHECYAQLPYTDLHVIACEDVLQVSAEEMLALKSSDFVEKYGVDHILLLNPKGEVMDPKSAYKYWRTEIGKGSNFSYWYSGALNQVGERLGWTSDEMFAASDRYRAKFSVGEEWRRGEITHGQTFGYVDLPDKHRRVRFEATPMWAQMFRAKWSRYDTPCVAWFIEKVIRRLQSRANNQLVNSEIQGTCATLAKRSVPTIRKMCQGHGWTAERDVRFMFLVHDELVFSVRRDLVTEFVPQAMTIMNDHPEIVSTLKMDCSPSVGLTFEPWHKTRARTGQIELREAPPLDFINKDEVGKEIPLSQWGDVVNWLYEEQQRISSAA
jgi:DNA polymerase I-like protein with 3'-5' exonuclease and polymerase domains